ncbi:hypothetical protein CDV36_004290 [Fusarium kuroshium]|uniref:Uncharacterized protein n=1 Tax=Fusarium kuroshium TaxID=2010991 RepID=A0A3M2SEM1_9HYPO|nr:hypothetical protein CDV36_004290 [Fusarium kuroshium]
MSAHQTEDPNLKDVEEEDGVKSLDIAMFECDIQGGRFHTENNPEIPRQRREIIQEARHGVDIRCTLIDVIHGAMSKDSDYWATILVLQFHFDPQKRARRISEATIELIFDVSDPDGILPEVEAVSFNGKYSFIPSKQSETIRRSGEGTVGDGYGAHLVASAKWEKVVSRETKDATKIMGSKVIVGSMLPEREAEWTLLENQTLKTGIPASVQVAVRIKRMDEKMFTCLPKLQCKADRWSSLQSFFGRVPVDDPVLLKPDMKPINKLMVYDTEELGSIDLQKLSDVTFTTMILDGQK